MRWIVLPFDGDIVWLAEALGRLVETNARGEAGLNILLVEADDALRAAIVRKFQIRCDSVTACRSIREANEMVSNAGKSAARFDVLVSPVSHPDGNALSLYLAATKSSPGMRWIVSEDIAISPRRVRRRMGSVGLSRP